MGLLDGTLNSYTPSLGVNTDIGSSINWDTYGSGDVGGSGTPAAGGDWLSGLGSFFTTIAGMAPAIITAFKGTTPAAGTGMVNSTVGTSTPDGYIYPGSKQTPAPAPGGIDTNMILLIGAAVLGTVLLTKVLAK